jgi:hypothetical protein
VFGQLHYSEPEREFHSNGAAYHYQVEGPGVFFVEHFEFVRREGRWAIMHQVIDLRAGKRPEGMADDREPPRVTSDFQAWADGNRNGMLSGADIIVIGSISYVGRQYYLNIKLISVETGEIIGSSIDIADDATGFYEMCNQAVYKLF